MNERSILFTPIRIASLEIPNRFARSATHDYMAGEDGTVTDRQVELYRRLAEGEVGLIVSGHAFVQPCGQASPRQIAVHDDRFIPGLARVAAAVHRFPSRIVLQIAHAGRQTKPKLCGGTPVSASAVPDPVSKSEPRALAPGEIETLIADFVRAARRAREAGFDGVQLHAAHGYLLSSFLSPHTNRRSDDWGGPPGNRARILLEILRGVKAACGRDFPVLVKLNSTDFLPGGLTLDEAVDIARLLEREGIDAIEVSGGTAEARRGSVWPGLRSEEEEGYFLAAAALIKRAVAVPVLGLGGFRTFAVMERAVASGQADMISLSRPFIRDPYLVSGFRRGQIAKSTCLSCNKCFRPRGIGCAAPRASS